MSTMTPAASTPTASLPSKPRNLVLMLDGTSNQFSEHNSNLIKLMSVVKADEGQLLFYSSGLGESPHRVDGEGGLAHSRNNPPRQCEHLGHLQAKSGGSD